MTDPSVPGGIYLCQAGSRISCGSCCGLYNVADPSRENLTEMLAYRTSLFQRTPRNLGAILEFKEAVETRENRARPFADFHHCPYIGLIGRAHSRIGCLLHPLGEGNAGIDYRGLSNYGGMACRIYFCPTYRKLTDIAKIGVLSAVGDWHLYGLVITEWRLIDAIFRGLSDRLDGAMTAKTIQNNDGFLSVIRDFLALKQAWPFRAAESRAPVNYFFDDGLYTRSPIDYRSIGVSPSPYDTLLVELESVFDTEDELHRAETLLEDLFQLAAATFHR